MRFVLLILQWLLPNEPAHDAALAEAHAYVETRFQASAVSRSVNGARQTGVWERPFPRSWKGPYFCGLWQTTARSEQACMEQRNPIAAWLTRRNELRLWLRYCRGDLTCALGGYGCGWSGAREPETCGVRREGATSYPVRVLQRAKRIRREIGTWGS